MSRFSLFPAILCLLIAANAHAATYYVAATGDDTHEGSLDRPWRTIQKAADTAVAGDTVEVSGGTYAGAVFNRHSGEPGNPITFKRRGDEEVVVHRASSLGADPVFIPRATAWRRIPGTNTWDSPTGSVPEATVGLMRNHDLWFKRTSHIDNVRKHGAEPWFYYNSAQKNVRVNSLTNPNADEFVALGAGARCFQVYGVQHLVFEGFIFEYAYDGLTMGKGNIAGNQASHITVRNCAARYCARRGMSAEGEPNAVAADFTFADSVVHTNGEHGFKLVNDVAGSGVYISGVRILNMHAYNNAYHGIQISVGTGDVAVRGSVAHDNGVSAGGRTAGCSEGNCSDMANIRFGTVRGGEISGNTVYGAAHGIFLYDVHDVRVFGNNVYGNGEGIRYRHANSENSAVFSNSVHDNESFGIRISDGDRGVFYNNTVYGNLGNQIEIGPNADGTVLKNNIVYAPAGTYALRTESASGIESDYNVIYAADAAPVWFSGSEAALETWRAYTDNDLHSLEFDPSPGFADAEARDFALTASSRARDKGVDLGDAFAVDHRGRARGHGLGWDIGAFELSDAPEAGL